MTNSEWAKQVSEALGEHLKEKERYARALTPGRLLAALKFCGYSHVKSSHFLGMTANEGRETKEADGEEADIGEEVACIICGLIKIGINKDRFAVEIVDDIGIPLRAIRAIAEAMKLEVPKGFYGVRRTPERKPR